MRSGAAGGGCSACCDARAPARGDGGGARSIRGRGGCSGRGRGAAGGGGGGSATRDPARTPRAMSALRPRARRAPLLFALAAALLPHADRVA